MFLNFKTETTTTYQYINVQKNNKKEKHMMSYKINNVKILDSFEKTTLLFSILPLMKLCNQTISLLCSIDYLPLIYECIFDCLT